MSGGSLCEGLQIHDCPMTGPESAIRVSQGWSRLYSGFEALEARCGAWILGTAVTWTDGLG